MDVFTDLCNDSARQLYASNSHSTFEMFWELVERSKLPVAIVGKKKPSYAAALTQGKEEPATRFPRSEAPIISSSSKSVQFVGISLPAESADHQSRLVQIRIQRTSCHPRVVAPTLLLPWHSLAQGGSFLATQLAHIEHYFQLQPTIPGEGRSRERIWLPPVAVLDPLQHSQSGTVDQLSSCDQRASTSYSACSNFQPSPVQVSTTPSACQ